MKMLEGGVVSEAMLLKRNKCANLPPKSSHCRICASVAIVTASCNFFPSRNVVSLLPTVKGEGHGLDIWEDAREKWRQKKLTLRIPAQTVLEHHRQQTPTMSDSGLPPSTRHRADDDMEALASGSFAPPSLWTPNGEVDLLSGEAASVLAAAAPVDAPSTRFSIDDSDGDDDDISHATPHYDSSGAAIVIGKNKGSDPSGQGAREPFNFNPSPGSNDDDAATVSSNVSSSNTGKEGAQLNKLSVKTTKIMSDYQSYLAEIETEFPSHEGDPASGINNNGTILTNVNTARANIRDSYNQDQTAGAIPPFCLQTIDADIEYVRYFGGR